LVRNELLGSRGYASRPGGVRLDVFVSNGLRPSQRGSDCSIGPDGPVSWAFDGRGSAGCGVDGVGLMGFADAGTDS
jgi:hypothetical protein